MVAEQGPYVRLTTPKYGRKRAGRRRWRVRPEQLEEVARDSVGCEVHHPNGAARTTHSHELARGRMVVRREHRAKARRHDVEFAVVKGKRLRVGLAPFEPDPLRGAGAAAGFDVCRRDVRGND